MVDARLRQRRQDRSSLIGLRAAAATALGAVALGIVAVSAGAASMRTGGTEFRGHVFPVTGPHSARGFIGEFGAPRSGGRNHEGFDIVAGCGAPLVAVRGGRVRRAGYDPVLYGNYLLIHGEGERRSYFYAHLRRPAWVGRGERVFTGQPVGVVGATGNARTVGCHLHFEIHVDGNPIDPGPALRRWDASR